LTADFDVEVEKLRSAPISISHTEYDLNVLRVSFKSTGARGDNWGGGSRHLLTFENVGSTGWMLRVVDERGDEVVVDQPAVVELLFGGDAELRTLIKALKKVVTKAEKELKGRGLWPTP